MSREALLKATAIQNLAARPTASVALRASAGSGKTKVLVDRFVRLCVQDGPGRAEPRSILAITFTRKAAVEIQERLLSRARAMALAPDQELRADLARLLGREPGQEVTPSEMDAAAGLYEKILEDVSGLAVGTIHAFCQAILGRFAAEAGLDPHAALLENTDDLVEEALDQLEREITADADLATAAREAGKDPASVRSAVRAMHLQRLRLDRWAHHLQDADNPDAPLPPLRRAQLQDAMIAQVERELFTGLDLPAGDTRAGLLAAMGRELDALLEVGLDRVKQGLPADIARAQAKSLEKTWTDLSTQLRDLQTAWRAGGAAPAALVPELTRVFLTTASQPRVWSRVKVDDLGPLFNALFLQEARPLLGLIRSHGYLELLRVNTHLLGLALRLLDICDELKRRDQVIDFQDLEDFAGRLMGSEARALSLLFRLDDSISHILLDEFQDTNFNQWDILAHFVDEFLSGGPDPDRPRTVFVVGDVKQSIYGFRGAEPELFARVCANSGLESLVLPTNFRSVPAVVDAVGCVFTAPPLRDFLPPGEDQSVWQDHARSEQPGPVVVVEAFRGPDPGDGEEDDGAADDRPGGDQLAAAAAAGLARRLVDGAEPTWEGFGDQVTTRPLQWNDLLVLCRSRTEIAVYEKAFRDAGIPVAAAGRGTLAASREVQDLLALLRWLSYPEDDLALASVLRSPIFRLTEADFQQALVRRGLEKVDAQGQRLPPARLWQSIRQVEADPRLGPAVTLLRRWRGRVGLESCHDLLRRIYREGALLERYQAAGGSQARENLLRLHDLSLAPDVAATPTVRRLVEVIERAARLGAEEEAVALPDQDRGRVRFMTIHGAKGLEAPVVLLVDADRRLGKQDTHVRLLPDENRSPLLFKVDRKFRDGITGADLPASSVERAAHRAVQRGQTEDANLLYVALTRARDRLYVLGGEKCTREEHDSFLRQLTRAAAAAPCGTVLRLRPDDLPPAGPPAAAHPAPQSGGGAASPAELETIAGRRWTPPALTPRVRTVTPSTLATETPGQPEPPERRPQAAGDDASGETSDRQGALERGNLVHLLLQQAADLGAMPQGTGPEHAEAAAVFANPALAWIFHPQREQGRGLSEAPLIHRTGPAVAGQPEERVTGIIDRLVLRAGRADIIDYKTNRTGGDPDRIEHLVEHYRPQLETYRQAVEALFPDRTVGAWLLFTEPVPGRPAGLLREVV